MKFRQVDLTQFLLIGAIVTSGVFLLKMVQKKLSPNHPVSSQSSFQTNTPTIDNSYNPDADAPTQTLDNIPNSKPKEDSSQTAACESTFPMDYVFSQISTAKDLISLRQGSVFSFKEFCYKAGSRILVKNEWGKDMFFSRIVKIDNNPVKNYRIEDFQNYWFGIYKTDSVELKSKEVVELTLAIDESTIIKENLVEHKKLPEEHCCFPVMTKNDFKTLKASNSSVVLIDARGTDATLKDLVPGATQIPYSNLKRSPKSLEEEIKSLKKDRTIVVFGSDLQDYNPISLLKELRANNFTQLHWLRGGAQELLNLLPPSEDSLPFQIYNHQSISYLVTEKKMSLIDIRPPELYFKQAIKNSTNYPFISEGNPIDLNASLKTMANQGDSFPAIDEKKLKPNDFFIIYGESKHSWKAIRAALWLMKKGYQPKIYLNGMEEWEALSAVSPEKYPNQF